jgi:hypothetical protein
MNAPEPATVAGGGRTVRPPGRLQVLFIGGHGRSGSTLLERLLGELPGVCPLGEVMRLWERVRRDDVPCGCGTRFTACDFWTDIGARAFGGWDNVALERIPDLWRKVGRFRHAVRRMGPGQSSHRQDLFAEYTDYYLRIYAAAAEATGARVIVDSSKDPGLAMCLRSAGDVNLRVIHLVRDPRGVAYSMTKRVPNIEGERGMKSPMASALHWTKTNGMWQLASAGRPAMSRVRYEDLIDDPAGMIGRLAEFLRLSVDEDGLSFLRGKDADLGIMHSAGGNRIRFIAGSTPLRRDDAWRTALPARHRLLVSAVCLPLMATYGYPHRSSI